MVLMLVMLVMVTMAMTGLFASVSSARNLLPRVRGKLAGIVHFYGNLIKQKNPRLPDGAFWGRNYLCVQPDFITFITFLCPCEKSKMV
jgi:hypothetical protein